MSNLDFELYWELGFGHWDFIQGYARLSFAGARQDMDWSSMIITEKIMHHIRCKI